MQPPEGQPADGRAIAADLADKILRGGLFRGSDFCEEVGGSPHDSGAPPAAPTSLPPPEPDLERLGNYSLHGELGRGGMGVVLLGYDDKLERAVAIKRPLQTFSPTALERFQREARATAALRHPHVVSTYEVGRDEEGPYLVLEFVEGPSLAGVLEARGALPARRAAQICAQVASALEAAHEAGVLHRDVKPSNVLLRSPDLDEALLSDFGLAKSLAERTGPTLAGQVFGSPAYMAPEQLVGGEQAVDARADVYALGAALYECLTGAAPHGQTTLVERLQEADEVLPLRQANPAIPAELEAICMCCLERDPQRRYPSARALREDLERYLHGEPVKADLPGWPRRLALWGRRQRGSLLAALGLVCCALLALGLALSLTSSNRSERAEALVSRLIQTAERFRRSTPPQSVIDEARETATLALSHDASARTHLRVAGALAALGARARAAELLEASIALHPPGYSELEQLHRIEEQVRRSSGPSDAMLRAIGASARYRDLQHPFLSWSRARVAAARGELQEAIAHYSNAIRGGLAGLRMDRGVLHKRLGAVAAAREDFQAMTAIDRRHPWPAYQLGLLETEQAAWDEAEEHFTRALALDSGFDPARTERALARLLQGRKELALTDLSRVLAHDDPRFRRSARRALAALSLALTGGNAALARLWDPSLSEPAVAPPEGR